MDNTVVRYSKQVANKQEILTVIADIVNRLDSDAMITVNISSDRDAEDLIKQLEREGVVF
jgi:homospermidine synthase